MEITIIIPFLNEEEIIRDSLMYIKKSYSDFDCQIILVDSGSNDNSFSIAADITRGTDWALYNAKLEKPSIGKCLNFALNYVKTEFVLFLPVDVTLPPEAFSHLIRVEKKKGYTCGGFVKLYQPTTRLLKMYAWIQNFFRSEVLRNLVWTNAMYMKKSILSEFQMPQDGFLEDVILSDYLKKEKGWGLVKSPVLVSSRKYHYDSTLKRIIINLFVIFLYRLKLASPEQLKKIYSKS